MKIKFSYPFAVFIFALFIFVFSSFIKEKRKFVKDYTNLEYQIRTSSTLEVNGKTNINSFCCSSNERFQKKKLDYIYEENNDLFLFQNTRFDIAIDQLDCGKKKINNDLFKALKVNEYPNISIHLIEVLNSKCQDLSTCDEWIDFQANTEITITCETEQISIPILVKKLDNRSFRITGGTTLNLCDFDIKAPTALMGLIKVKDAIDFNFDLYVDIN